MIGVVVEREKQRYKQEKKKKRNTRWKFLV